MIGIIYGHARGGPDRAARLGLMRCGDRLCFRGLAPGRATWTDALIVFNGHLSANGFPYYERIILSASARSNALETIHIEQPLSEGLTAGEFIALYGDPECVEVNRYARMLTFYYPAMQMLVRFDDEPLQPYSLVEAIILWNIGANGGQVAEVCKLESGGLVAVLPWRGFADLKLYRPR